MKPSEKLVSFIAREEGFRGNAYRPLPTDRWTVGFGFTYINGTPVKEGDTIEVSKARNELRQLLTNIGNALSKKLPDSVTQQEFDAVVSLAYNIGITAFISSTTGTLFYLGDDISNRFALYNRSGGKVIQGLVNRRNAEREIYVNGDYSK